MSRFCANCAVLLESYGAAKSIGFWATIRKIQKVRVIDALNEVFYRRKKSFALTEEERFEECRRSLCNMCYLALGNLHNHFTIFKNRSAENSFVMQNYINAILNVTDSLPEPEKVDAEVQTKWTWTQKKLIAAVEKQTGPATSESIGPSVRQPGQWLLVYGEDKNRQVSKNKEKQPSGLPRRKLCVTPISSQSQSNSTGSQTYTYPWVQPSKINENEGFLEQQHDYEPDPEAILDCGSIKFEMEDHNYTNQGIPDRLTLDEADVEQNDTTRQNNVKEEEEVHMSVRIQTPNINIILPSDVPRETLCPVCSFDVRFPRRLQAHLLAKHRPRIRVQTRKRVKECERTCTDCGKVFFKLSRYESHVNWNKEHGSCNRAIFVCSYPTCKRAFRYEFFLKSHLSKHETANVKTIECSFPTCTKKFKTRSIMKKHAETHGTRQTYVCEECGSVLYTCSGLYRHVRDVHRFPRKKITTTERINLKLVEEGELNSVRPFTCTVDGCGQKFLKHQYKMRHMRAHKYSFQYPCQRCPGISFPSLQGLNSHMSRTHSIYSEKNRSRRKSKLKDKVGD